MEKPKRPRRRQLQENLVEMAVKIIENDIDPMYHRKRHLEKIYIHKQPNNKYFKLFMKIAQYLEELKGNYKNPMDELFRDYFFCICRSYRKAPELMRFSPTPTNRIKFDEFIYRYTIESGEEYWLTEDPVRHEIVEFETDEEPLTVTFTEV